MAFNLIRLNISIVILLSLACFVIILKDENVFASKAAQTDEDGRVASKLNKLLDWDSYTVTFKKKYSSVEQKMVRQKIYMARALRVFKTSLKYMVYMISHYTAINKFSDLTVEEEKRILNGELDGNPDDVEKDYTDDSLAKDILVEVYMSNLNTSEPERLESLSTNKIEVELESERETALKQYNFQLDGRKVRKKRNLDHSLDINDLIREEKEELSLPNQVQSFMPIIPPQNPDYEPKSVLAKPNGNGKREFVEDIPIEHVESYLEKTGHLFSSGVSYIKSGIGKLIADVEEKLKPHENRVVENLSNKVVIRDWRDSGCIGSVKSQEVCNCCYAISSMAFMEWALCMSQGNMLTPLSAQYIVSCGIQYRDETSGKMRLGGCESGSSKNAIDFVREYGVELESNFAFYDAETECPIKKDTPKKKKGYIRPNVGNPIRLNARTNRLDLALKVGPVIVSMNIPDDFAHYAGGIIDHCHENNGHSMLIVGNAIEDDVEYMLIKNSYGTSWGYDGYLKFKRSALLDCVKEYISPIVSFPSNRAKLRHIKAYLADKDDPSAVNNEDVQGSEIIALYNKQYGERSYFPY